ncbi:MAG: adenosylcobalamin-dependent ribonucleoside-diphosphate reductase [Chloroflexota bacterium]
MVRLPIKRTRHKSLQERLTENVHERILPARYLLRDDEGEIIETPEGMFRRVADNVVQPEVQYGNDVEEIANAFYEAMTMLEFIPNSPTLMNAGAEFEQLAACFVISPRDDLNSIFDTLRQAANILQTGGGVGYTFTKLRPKGDIVRSTGGVASGPLSFMHVYDAMCGALKQGGRRRGAQMGILRVDHPDAGRFALAKRREGVLTNFNLSVAITDEFVQAVDEDKEYTLYNPRTGEPFEVVEQTAHFYNTAHEEADPRVVEENFWRDHAGEVEGIAQYREQTELEIGAPMTLPARFIWDVIVHSAWSNGEPGLFMIDQANCDHTFDVEAHPNHIVEATNPCGEEPLEEYEACALGHINLSLMVAEDAPYWPDFHKDAESDLPTVVSDFLEKAVDWDHLLYVARLGTRFLDNATTVSKFPLETIEKKQKGLRNIGLGLMGFAEMLMQMGVVYGSEASFEIARQLMLHIARESKRASHDLAEERGVFEGWEDSKFAHPADYPEWFRDHTGLDPKEWASGFKVRNHHTTMIAPTGTTSMIANTSSGCEPLFDVVYFKDVGEDIAGERMLVEFADYFLRTLEANEIDVEKVKAEAEEMMRQGTYEGPGSLPIPKEIAQIFVTANDVPSEAHVRIQAAFQEHVDGAISKTINLPNEATREDVERAYRLAIDLDCKGLTVYRVGSREEEVLRRAFEEQGKETKQVIEDHFGSLEAFCLKATEAKSSLCCPQCGSTLWTTTASR